MKTPEYLCLLACSFLVLVLGVSSLLKTDRINQLERRIEALERSSPVKP
jgi:hypothetical protein